MVSDDGLYGSGECRRPQARPSACPLPKGSLPETLVLCLTDLLRGGHPATGLGIGGLFFALERELVVSVRGESGVNRLNDHRSLSDCRGDPLHRPGADISNGEDSRKTRLQKVGSARERPVFTSQILRRKIRPCLDELFLVEGKATVKPRGAGNRADHDEEPADGPLHHLAGSGGDHHRPPQEQRGAIVQNDFEESGEGAGAKLLRVAGHGHPRAELEEAIVVGLGRNRLLS